MYGLTAFTVLPPAAGVATLVLTRLAGFPAVPVPLEVPLASSVVFASPLPPPVCLTGVLCTEGGADCADLSPQQHCSLNKSHTSAGHARRWQSPASLQHLRCLQALWQHLASLRHSLQERSCQSCGGSTLASAGLHPAFHECPTMYARLSDMVCTPLEPVALPQRILRHSLRHTANSCGKRPILTCWPDFS